jgi:hypothetical protein
VTLPHADMARLAAVFLSVALAVTGCGGGSSDSPASPAPPSAPSVPAAPAATGATGATGSPTATGITGTGQTPPLVSGVSAETTTPSNLAAGANVVPVTVGGGPSASPNLPYVTVTVCIPGTSSCQSIPNVLVDTGSIGLRLFASVFQGNQNYPAQTVADGRSLAECTQFADGYTWGPVRNADVRIGGQQASNLPINIIGDQSFSEVPSACASGGSNINSLARFGSNGVLGVGLFVEDCGPACARSGNPGVYYACDDECVPTALPLTAQVRNPVASFSSNNNGVILSFPAIPPSGVAALTGTLTFGIGTQPNNGLGAATVLNTDPGTGYITTLYNGRSFPRGFFDSGSNGIFFRDTAIPRCRTSFYCPDATLTLQATNVGVNGARSTVDFNILNADQVFAVNPDVVAVPGLGSTLADANIFDWGLPFFFGRNVFTAIEGRATPAGPGPYYAY